VSRWFLFFSFPNWRFLPLNRAASVAILPFALFVSDISLGARWVFSFQWVLLPDNRPLLLLCWREAGPGLSRSHPDSAVKLGY
jgi:hypothetical protein